MLKYFSVFLTLSVSSPACLRNKTLISGLYVYIHIKTLKVFIILFIHCACAYCASSFFSGQVFSSKKVLVFGAMEDAVPAAPSLPPAAPSLPSKIQELKQRKAQLTAARKAAPKELKAKERQMTRLCKHLQKLKPSDLAELVTLAPAVKAKAKAKAKARA